MQTLVTGYFVHNEIESSGSICICALNSLGLYFPHSYKLEKVYWLHMHVMILNPENISELYGPQIPLLLSVGVYSL